MKALTVSSVISIAGVIAFVLIVTYLHIAQQGYDPVHQLMSELALGYHGGLMLAAFCSIALSLLALALGAGKPKSLTLLSGILTFAALCFLGAGIFPLGATSEIHILLVAAAFIAVGVAMYIAPSYTELRHRPRCRLYSWSILAVFALSAGAGGSVLPIGVSQRCAAAAMLLWIVISALRLRRQDIARNPQARQ